MILAVILLICIFKFYFIPPKWKYLVQIKNNLVSTDRYQRWELDNKETAQ